MGEYNFTIYIYINIGTPAAPFRGCGQFSKFGRFVTSQVSLFEERLALTSCQSHPTLHSSPTWTCFAVFEGRVYPHIAANPFHVTYYFRCRTWSPKNHRKWSSMLVCGSQGSIRKSHSRPQTWQKRNSGPCKEAKTLTIYVGHHQKH